MDASVYTERRAQQLAPILAAATELQGIVAAMGPSPDRSMISNAAVRLRVAADQITKLADGLRPYSEPSFYAELVPSLAKDDQGKHAANALEYVFSE
jgi:hypothetical protein